MLLLTSFNEKFSYGKLDCFLRVEDNKLNNLKSDNLTNRATKECW